jgi:hypothetical protein
MSITYPLRPTCPIRFTHRIPDGRPLPTGTQVSQQFAQPPNTLASLVTGEVWRPTPPGRCPIIPPDRARWPATEVPVPVDNAAFADLRASCEPGPERVAVNRVALAEFGGRVQREGAEDPVLQRSWSDVLALSEQSRSTPADQDRWKYVRRVLRRYGHPDLVA